MTKEKEFYYHGKSFESMDEMVEYALSWPDLPVDLEDFRDFLEQRFKEAEMNVAANPNFSNRTLYLLLRMNTDWATVERKKE
jgi:hypothetical protein